MAHLHASLESISFLFKPSSRRKTLAIKVKYEQVVVAFPSSATQQEVYHWVNKHRDWILKHVDSQPSLQQSKPYTLESELRWRGKRTSFNQLHCTVLGECLGLDEAFFEQPLPQQKQRLLAVCAQYASKRFPLRLAVYEEKLGLYSKKLKLRPYKSRWGSCRSSGEVALNTLLAMAPDSVLDYVVVHELCHLKHPNHSFHFWHEVERIIPTDAIHVAKQWLNEHGNELIHLYR